MKRSPAMPGGASVSRADVVEYPRVCDRVGFFRIRSIRKVLRIADSGCGTSVTRMEAMPCWSCPEKTTKRL